MDFKIAKKMRVNGDIYIILAIIKENTVEYAFANKLESLDGDPTNEYLVLSKKSEKLDIETNQEIITKLLPLFKNQIKKDLNEILN